MEFKKIGIIALIILLMCSFVMTVYADEINTRSVEAGNTITFETTLELKYNEYYFAPEGYENVMVFGNNTNSESATRIYLLYYADGGITSIGNAQIKGKFYVRYFSTEEELTEVLFNGQSTTINMHLETGYIGTLANYTLYVSDDYTKIYQSQNAPMTLADYFIEWTNAGNIYIPPCQHTNTQTQGVVKATTTAHGYTGDTLCLECGEIAQYGELEHKFNSNNVCYICSVVKDNTNIGSNVINNKTYYYPAGYPTLTVIFGAYNDLIIWSPENTILKIQSNNETWKVHYINEDGTASDSTTDYYYVTIAKNYSEYNFNYEDIVNTITNIETEYTNQESFYGYYYRAIVGKTIGTRQGHNNFTAITIEELFDEHAEHIEDTPEVIPEPEEPEITPPTDEEGGIIGLLKTILEYLNPFNWIKANNGTLFFDKAGELINENLKDNKFYTSILSVRDSLMDLFNEDYTSRTGFYELGLTNITLGKPEEIVYIDQGNQIIGPWEQEVGKIEGTIDFGLDNVKVLNFDWYFGRDLGDGKYTKGMKPTIDNLISAFLWVMFAWALYKNMPNWISGELTQIGNLTNEAIYIGSKKVTTKLPTLEEKKKKDTSGMRKFEGTKTFDINPKTNKKGK